MLLDKLMGGAREMLATVRGPYRMAEIPGVLRLGQQSASGQDVTEETALSLSAVFAACRLLSQTKAQLPLAVMRKSGDRKEPALTHPAYRLLHTQPNPEMTAYVYHQTCEFHRLLWGATYSEIVWTAGGNVAAIWPIEPWRVVPKRDDADSSLYYHVDGQRRVNPEDMLTVPLISLDGVCGRSFVQYACESLGLSMSAQEFASRFFGSGARPGGILKHPGTPKKEARDELRKGWMETHGGPENAHKTAVIWGGWEYVAEDGSVNPTDSQLLETRRFGVEEVARWMNVPPHLLRDLSRATFSNIEEQSIEFVVHTVQPILVAYEQEYDRKLLDPPALYSKHNVAGLLRGNSQARSAFYREMFGIGVYSINDIRDFEDENGIGPEGDAHLVPVNMQPIERAINPPEPAKPQAPAAQDKPVAEPISGQSQPDANPSPPQYQASVEAKRRLVEQTVARMLRKECNAARRAAAKPDAFMSWMDEFYPKHELTMTDALMPVLPLVIPDGEAQAPAVAKSFTTASYQELLDLSGTATPATFAAVVDGRMAEWETSRPEAAAKMILGA